MHDAHDHEHSHHHHHGPLPTSGRALDLVAFSATLHCLTGCAIGEITGMVVGTALGFSDWGTVALAVALAFLFGYTLTSWPLLRAGFAFAAVVPIALATDTISIAIMEVVDNAIMLVIPGAMEAGLTNALFWGSLSVALVIAGAAAYPVNRRLIARGKGHAVLHETGIHGGPSPRTVGVIAAIAGTFGTAVLLAEALDADDFDEIGGWLALGLYAVYMALAFGLRTWLQLRRTGESGFKGISGRPGSLESIAGVLFVVAIAVGVAAPVLDVTGVLDPLDALDSAGVRATGVAIFVVGLVGTQCHQPGDEHHDIPEPDDLLHHHERARERLDRDHVAEAGAGEGREAQEQELDPGALAGGIHGGGEAAGLDRLHDLVCVGERPRDEGEGRAYGEHLVAGDHVVLEGTRSARRPRRCRGPPRRERRSTAAGRRRR